MNELSKEPQGNEANTLLAAVIERGDVVKTKYGIGNVVEIKQWSDGIGKYIEYYVETNIGSYRLTRGEISKMSVG
jgi:hypothetical protein